MPRLPLLLALFACGTESAPEPPAPPSAPVALDRGNLGDGRDLEVQLPEAGHRLRVHVSPPDGSLTGQAFAEVPAGTSVLRGTADAVDTTGAPIAEGVRYFVSLTAVVDGVESEPSEPAVVELGPKGEVVTLTEIAAGTGGMEVDLGGDILMGDFGTSLSGPGEPSRGVFRITPAGEVSVFATGFSKASGNALADDGTLFQSDIGTGEVHRVDAQGGRALVTSGLSAPVGIATDGDTLFVACCGDHTVVQVDPDGSTTTLSDDPLLRCPNGIARGPDGTLYVANFYDGNLLAIDPTTGSASVFASFGGTLGHVSWGNDRLYVAVRGGHRIAEVALDGTITDLTGDGVRGGRDGGASRARVSFPNDLALSPDGQWLYFNDVHPDEPDPNIIGPVSVRVLLLPADR